MPLQTQVGFDVAVGLPGDLATPNQGIYQPINFIAEDVVTVGNFVYASATAPETMAVAYSTGNAKPLGLLKRDMGYMNYDLMSPGTLDVPAGSNLTVAIKGDFWVVSSTNASLGDAVFADLSTGAISTAPAGTTVAGSIETNWKVKTSGAAGDMIIISNWE